MLKNRIEKELLYNKMFILNKLYYLEIILEINNYYNGCEINEKSFKI